MKKIFYSIIILPIFLITIFLIYLSTAGFETNKFNEFLEKESNRFDNNLETNFDKIKIKLDLKKLNFFITTSEPKIKYYGVKIKIKKINAYLDLMSLVFAKPNIKNVFISTEKIKTANLKRVVRYLKPSNSKRFLINNIEGGDITSNFNIFFDDKNNIKNYEIDGFVKNLNLKFKNFNFEKSSFIFLLNNAGGEIKNLRTSYKKFAVNSGEIAILNDKFLTIKGNIKSDFLLNNSDLSKFLNFEKKLFNNLVVNGKLLNKFNIKFDQTLKIEEYNLNILSDLNNTNAVFSKSYKNNFLQSDIKKLSLKDTKLEIQYNSKNNNYIKSAGFYSLNDKEYQTFNFENFFKGKKNNLKINLNFNQKYLIPIINYNNLGNDTKIIAEIVTDENNLNIKSIVLKENKNIIKVKDFFIKNKKIKKFGEMSIKTYINNELQNDLNIVFKGKTSIKGSKYDAANLTKLFDNKSNSNFLKDLNSELNIKIGEIKTTDKGRLNNFNLIGKIKRGKLVKIISKGEFSNNKFLDISLKEDEISKKKILEIYSDLPEPLLSNYKFFKGLSGGNLLLNSIYDDKGSNSKLLIENFKVKSAPGLVKLLSLADFGGMVDAVSGEGLSFDRLEMLFEKDEKVLNLKELYAIGPSISILMEGYIESNSGLVSIRGTMVPAKTLNRFLSKIPVVGNIIIPKEIGEGLFGVSFKMKGPPGNIKTSVNPIKSLTPRFIQKALKKTK